MKRRGILIILTLVFVFTYLNVVSASNIPDESSNNIGNNLSTAEAGNVFYVSPTGNDSNLGTETQPWATPGYGSKQLQAGDTLIIKDGVYIMDTYYEDMITPLVSGTSTSWITIKGEDGKKPVLCGKDNLFSAIDISGKSYILIENLEITSYNGMPFRGGIEAAGSPISHVEIKNLYIHHIDEFGINIADVDYLEILNCIIEYCGFGSVGGPSATDGGWRNVLISGCSLSYSGHYYQGGDGSNRPYDRPDGFGIEPSAGPVVIVNTKAEHNRGDGLDSKAENTHISNCIVANNNCDGIKLWGTGSKIENCLIYGRGDGNTDVTPWAPIVIGTETPNSNFQIINVTVDDFVGNNYLMHVQYDNITPINLTVKNTIFSGRGPGNSPIYIDDSVNFTLENNLFYMPNSEYVLAIADTTYESTQIEQLGLGNKYGDPLFIQPAFGTTGNYHLQDESPAIDNGTSTGAPGIDLDYIARPQGSGFDRGAYESISTLIQLVVNNRTGEQFSTIQEAVDNAEDEDTLTAYNGTYTENITINRQLTLRSSDDLGVIIQAADMGRPVILITASGSGSTIREFSISGASSSFGVYLDSADNCYLTDNTISGNCIGVYMRNSNNNMVSGNTIQGNGWVGVCMDNSINNTINGGNNIYGNLEGVYIVNSANGNTISGNNIHDNAGAGINILNNSTGNTISGNTAIFNNGLIGVLIRDSDVNNITGNNIQSNGWAGVVLDNADDNFINGGNFVSGNQEGFNLTNSVGNIIEGNTISDNVNIGISLINNSSGNEIINNVAISNNGNIGVYLRESVTNTVSGNNIQINSWVGICFDNATGNIINSDNNISSNLEGLYIVNNSNSNTIQGNNIHDNQDTGIYIDGSTNNQITSNTAISNNGVIGILARNANGNTISGNTVASNIFSGIALDNADSNNINGLNTVSGSQMGIYVTNTSNGNTINNNALQNNTWAGLVLDNASNTTIYQNNFINNPLQALTQNGSGNAFYQTTNGNYWSDWPSTEPRPVYGNEGLLDNYPRTTQF